MLFEFNGHRREVADLYEAQEIWEDYRDGADPDKAGSIVVSELLAIRPVSEVGNGGTVYENDRPVATVSYNGRVWTPEGQEITVDGDVDPSLEEAAREAAKRRPPRPAEITDELRDAIIAGTVPGVAQGNERAIVYDPQRHAFRFMVGNSEGYSLYAPATSARVLDAHWQLWAAEGSSFRPMEPIGFTVIRCTSGRGDWLLHHDGDDPAVFVLRGTSEPDGAGGWCRPDKADHEAAARFVRTGRRYGEAHLPPVKLAPYP